MSHGGTLVAALVYERKKNEKEIYERLIVITAIDENIIKDAISKKYSIDKEMNIDYYQDYIASLYDTKVLNISHFKDAKNYIETVSRLLNSGELEKMDIKYIET